MQRGFSLLETIIVITLIMILAAAGYVVTLSILKSQALLNNMSLVTSQVVLAQMDSYSQLDDASHGVMISSGSVVRFTGDSYAARDVEKDVLIVIPSSILVTGDTEVVFGKAGLRPDQAVEISLASATTSYDISVSIYGVLQVTKGNP